MNFKTTFLLTNGDVFKSIHNCPYIHLTRGMKIKFQDSSSDVFTVTEWYYIINDKKSEIEMLITLEKSPTLEENDGSTHYAYMKNAYTTET